MKRLVFILLLLAVFLAGCAKPGCDGKGDTVEDFKFLERGMSYKEIKACVGPYDSTGGSMRIFLLYDLKDGSRVILGFSSLNLDDLEDAAIILADGTNIEIIPYQVPE